jgi:hypothetical protein
LIAATVVDPASACAAEHRRGLNGSRRQSPFLTFCNLSNLDAVLQGELLGLTM